MKFEELPDEIIGCQKRILELNNLVVIEYSKKSCLERYVTGIDGDLDGLLFDEFATNKEDAIKQIWIRINMQKEINTDFPNIMAMPMHPKGIINDNLGRQITVRHFDLYFLWNINESYQHIAIVSSDVSAHYKVFPDLINFYLEQQKNGTMIQLKYGDLDSKEYVFTKTVFLYTDKLNVEKNEIFNYFKDKGLKLEIRDDEFRKTVYESKKPDFFICHDSRDKKSVADPLYNELSKLYAKVWYDKYSLEIGDSLTESIERGIKECRFGIIILSKNFLSNEKWAKNELQSLKTKQIIENEKTILPIWHEIDENDLKENSYWLIDKVGGNTNEGFNSLAKRLSDIVIKTKTKTKK